MDTLAKDIELILYLVSYENPGIYPFRTQSDLSLIFSDIKDAQRSSKNYPGNLFKILYYWSFGDRNFKISASEKANELGIQEDFVAKTMQRWDLIDWKNCLAEIIWAAQIAKISQS